MFLPTSRIRCRFDSLRFPCTVTARTTKPTAQSRLRMTAIVRFISSLSHKELSYNRRLSWLFNDKPPWQSVAKPESSWEPLQIPNGRIIVSLEFRILAWKSGEHLHDLPVSRVMKNASQCLNSSQLPFVETKDNRAHQFAFRLSLLSFPVGRRAMTFLWLLAVQNPLTLPLNFFPRANRKTKRCQIGSHRIDQILSGDRKYPNQICKSVKRAATRQRKFATPMFWELPSFGNYSKILNQAFFCLVWCQVINVD